MDYFRLGYSNSNKCYKGLSWNSSPEKSTSSDIFSDIDPTRLNPTTLKKKEDTPVKNNR